MDVYKMATLSRVVVQKLHAFTLLILSHQLVVFK